MEEGGRNAEEGECAQINVVAAAYSHGSQVVSIDNILYILEARETSQHTSANTHGLRVWGHAKLIV